LLVRSRKPRDEVNAAVIPLAEQYPEVRRFVEFINSSKRGIVR